MNILITGGAGFIGSTLIDHLLSEGHKIVSIDNFDNFYARSIKERNIAAHFHSPNFSFFEADIRHIDQVPALESLPVDVIVHLAAKAGVRPSLENPVEYFDVNINGTLQLLEFARKKQIRQFVFASSSSVYGINPNIPWKESEADLMPISPYASSKLAGEKIGFTYSHLYGIRFIALRLFTVYGPRQRPDLAISKFINAIMKGQPIRMYGDGSTGRDYTFVEDIVRGIRSAISYDASDYEIFNLGNNKPTSLSVLIDMIANITGTIPQIVQDSEQPGDVRYTCADIGKSYDHLSYCPVTSIKEGLEMQYAWLLNT
jgi:UDP-glucuronate 4-epimerase